MRDEIALFREEIIIYEEKISKLKETFMRKENKNAFFKVDLARSRQKFRKFFSSFIITDKKSTELFNSVIFIQNNNSMFEG